MNWHQTIGSQPYAFLQVQQEIPDTHYIKPKYGLQVVLGQKTTEKNKLEPIVYHFNQTSRFNFDILGTLEPESGLQGPWSRASDDDDDDDDDAKVPNHIPRVYPPPKKKWYIYIGDNQFISSVDWVYKRYYLQLGSWFIYTYMHTTIYMYIIVTHTVCFKNLPKSQGCEIWCLFHVDETPDLALLFAWSSNQRPCRHSSCEALPTTLPWGLPTVPTWTLTSHGSNGMMVS